MIILAGLLAFYIYYYSRNNLEIQNIDVELQVNGDNAYKYIQDQLNIGYRIPGTEERIYCADYFISKFQEININFSYVLHKCFPNNGRIYSIIRSFINYLCFCSAVFCQDWVAKIVLSDDS